MTIFLENATLSDAEALHKLQIKAFLPLLEKYQDVATNPACEPLEKTKERITDPLRGFYKIVKDNVVVGAIVIKFTSSTSLWIGPIFVDPDAQNQKIGQKAMILLEKLFPDVQKYELATLSQELGNIHLYQKLGYKLTDRKEKIQQGLDLVFFEKTISKS